MGFYFKCFSDIWSHCCESLHLLANLNDSTPLCFSHSCLCPQSKAQEMYSWPLIMNANIFLIAMSSNSLSQLLVLYSHSASSRPLNLVLLIALATDNGWVFFPSLVYVCVYACMHIKCASLWWSSVKDCRQVERAIPLA